MSYTFHKSPGATLDYMIDWSTWLDTGELITSSTWSPVSDDLMDSDTNGNTDTTVWLSGGTAGVEYSFDNTIVTDQGRTETRRLVVSVVDRILVAT